MNDDWPGQDDELDADARGTGPGAGAAIALIIALLACLGAAAGVLVRYALFHG